jgi:DeoR family transcriptional regulator, suf operon transcriptional repressor
MLYFFCLNVAYCFTYLCDDWIAELSNFARTMESKLINDEHSKTTRERVMRTLLTRQRCTINELAEAVDINPISVRHHISKLEADRLVTSEEERHGVGRPRRLYYLTEAGLERFPTRYLRLTVRLLEQLKDTLPGPMVKDLFSQMAAGMAADYETEVDGLNMEQRLNLVTTLLGEEGFTVEWERKGDEYLIREINCPYYRIGQNHPEVCSVDQTLISTMLSVPAEKVQCILNGDAHCTYVVPSLTPSEEAS